MKSRLKNIHQDDNKVIRITRRWNFIKRKVHVTMKKFIEIIGQKDVNRGIIGLRIWFDEAESFMKYHSRESRNTQEIFKIKVFLEYTLLT